MHALRPRMARFPFLSSLSVLFLLISFVGSVPLPVHAVSPNVVISQVYGGGGNSGAPFKNDFVELFNRGTTAASLSGWSIQYASATGTGNFGSNAVTALSGSLAPGQYYLVQLAGGTNGVALPTPNATGTVNMSGTGGKVALVNVTTGLACNGGSTPCSPAQLAQIVDLVGWDGANFYEGAPAPETNSSSSVVRLNDGCVDSDNNASDLGLAPPAPRNTGSPPKNCAGDAAPAVFAMTPVIGASNVALNTDVVIKFTEAVNVSGSWYGIVCTASGAHSAAVSGGPTTFTLNPNADFAYGETCTVTVVAAQVADQDSNDPPNNMAANYSWNFTTVAPPTLIRDIQGTGHMSPKNGQNVTGVPGIVTGLRTAGTTRGFYMQDPNPDADIKTSEGIFVFTGSTSNPTALVAVGDSVKVNGAISEYRAGATSLTLTEITGPTVTVLSHGNALPPPVVLGTGGRIPPTAAIEDDATGDVETSGVFDPSADGIDFYESLEGMRVQLNNPVAVGPTVAFGGATPNREIPVVGDQGANASDRTARGGVIIHANDFNPERIILNDMITGVSPLPFVNVKDSFPGAVLGTMDYSFGNFKLEVTQLPSPNSGGLAQEVTAVPPAYQLAAATFNVENLSPTDPPSKFSTLAGLIVNNLKAPDLVAIEEVQDNNGVTDDGTVAANTTYTLLINAIRAAGGPTYQYRQIDPANDQDGGAPGGNIRQGFLFRTDRGLAFVDRPGGTATAATTVQGSGNATRLSYSPGRISPTNAAFLDSRKPLAGEFTFKGDKVFVIANHFNSKSGDQPLFGHLQPPTFSSAVQRTQQAQIVNGFVSALLSADPKANVVVLGDLNDFEFASPIVALQGNVLKDLIETLPANERYSYVYDGNSETLDHILISNPLFGRKFSYDVVHVNSEFANQSSDHEPQVARLCADRTGPSLSVTLSPNPLWPPDHKYVTVKAKVTLTDNADSQPQLKLVSVLSNEPDKGLGDGDTPNDIVKIDDYTFNLRAERSALGQGRVYTVTYQATDACGNTTTVAATAKVPLNQGNK